MNYIVMDLEFNQPFEFGKGNRKSPNPEIPFEIIQIGCVKLDEKFNQIDSFNMLIKPAVYKRIHPYVQKITKLRANSFVNAKNFPQVFEMFLEFLGDEDNVFCVWGEVDLQLLYKNVDFYKLDSNCLPKKYVNVQTIAGKKLSWASGRLIGLKNAIEAFEIEVDIPFHDAYNDAYYTSLIFKRLNVSKSDIKIYSRDKNAIKTSDKKFSTDIFALYTSIEKEIGRRLTRKEKELCKNIYLAGLSKKFERK